MVVLLAAVLAPAPRAQTSNAADLYKEALAREALLRKDLDAHQPSDPALPLLRRVRIMVGAYEDIARLFPTSGVSDSALWQGGLLASDAFWRFGEETDRTMALRLLNAIAVRFPASALVTQVQPHVARLEQARAWTAPSEVAASSPLGPAGEAAPPFAAPSAAAPGAATAGGTLIAIHREPRSNVLRITLELAREVEFSEERLDSPPRLYVDLQNAQPAETLVNAIIPFPDDVVNQIRVGLQADGRTRVAMELSEALPYSVYVLDDPFRIVVDFERDPPHAGTALPSLQPEVPPAAARQSD